MCELVRCYELRLFPISISHCLDYHTKAYTLRFFRLPWKNTTKHFVIVLIDTNLPRSLVIYIYMYISSCIYLYA